MKKGWQEKMQYINEYLQDVIEITKKIDQSEIDKMVNNLVDVRKGGGRIFFIGVGGGAGNASHAVNDFRKIADIESYAPTDNVSELTARINDEGWETCYAEWLRGSRLCSDDAIFVFSVGGGDKEKNISVNLIRALEFGKETGAKILGITGRDGGFTAQIADACVIVPTVRTNTITTHTESFQVVLWHLLVSHPKLMKASMKWESLDKENQR